MDNGATELPLADLRKENLRRTLDQLRERASSILLLTLRWKDLDEHFDFTKTSIDERFKELQSREDQLNLAEESISVRFAKFNLIQESIKEQAAELEKREKDFVLKQKLAVEEHRRDLAWIEKLSEELELVRKSTEGQLKTIEEREEQFDSIKTSIEERFEELKSIERLIGERSKELKLKEEQFELKQASVEERFKDIASREKHFEQCLEEYELKEKRFDERCRELEAKGKKYEESFEEIRSKERDFKVFADKRSKELEKELRKRLEEIECREKQFEQCSRDFELKEKCFKEQCEELKAKERKYEECFEEFRSKEKDFKIFAEGLSEELEKKFMDRFKELELKEKQFEERSRELELKEKRFADNLHSQVKIEPPETDLSSNSMDYSSSANLHFCVTMDGKNLQIFLNEHWTDDLSIQNEVAAALRLSSDPAKLVLDAMQGFYPPHLKKGDKVFEETVVRRTCTLLLEQLMKLSPRIRPNLKSEAMKLAFDWITKMTVDVEHSLEVLGFLQLLASYELASAFDVDELFIYMETVAKHIQAPELFRVLGFADKISGFIRSLIEKKKHVEAISFIYAFELVDEFPPVPLLEDYLKSSKKAAREIYKAGKKSPRSRNEATKKRIADLRAVIRCIEDHKLESKFSVAKIEHHIASLENHNAQNSKGRPTYPSKKNCVVSKAADVASDLAHTTLSSSCEAADFIPSSITASTTGLAPPTISEQRRGDHSQLAVSTAAAAVGSATATSKIPTTETTCQQQTETALLTDQARFDVPSNEKIEKYLSERSQLDNQGPSSSRPEHKFTVSMDTTGLRMLLDKHKDFDLVSTEVLDALQSVLDPADFVLDAMKAFCLSTLAENGDLKLAVSKEHCILLLVQLGRVLTQIKPQVKEAAMSFAVDWKLKLIKQREDCLEVICFLQFLVAYELVPAFNADELLGLLDADYWCKNAPNLCQVFGLADMIPSIIQDLIRKEQRLEAIKHIYALDMVDKFPPLPILTDHLTYVEKISGKPCKRNTNQIQMDAMIEEIDALRALSSCVGSKCTPKIFEERIAQLEKERAEKENKFDESKAKTLPPTGSPEHHNKEQCNVQTTVPTAVCPSIPAHFTTGAPTTASATETQLQFQRETKRPRIALPTEPPVSASVGAPPIIHSAQPSYQQPAGLFMNQGTPYSTTSAASDCPSMNWHTSFHHYNVVPGYSLNTFTNAGEHHMPMPFSFGHPHGEVAYDNRPVHFR